MFRSEVHEFPKILKPPQNSKCHVGDTEFHTYDLKHILLPPKCGMYRMYNVCIYVLGKGKGKAVPLQAWSGPEGSRKLRFPDFMTLAQESGYVVSLTHRPPLPQGNTPGTHFC
jgi:hypothetical protein